jgi:zinc/manganese transport system ATP-binding protein
VPQKIQLDPDMPVRARDLVGLGLDGHRLGLPLPSRARRQQVQEMLRAVDALRFADERVGNLSGGEQQRVMIAHALISQPRLLLLDEPLANLDIRSAQEIIALLAEVSKRGVSVFISAHEMNPLLPVMDRLVYLAGGRAASGTTAEVVTSEVLSGLYGNHVDVIRVHGRVLVVAGTGDGLGIPAEAGAAPCSPDSGQSPAPADALAAGAGSAPPLGQPVRHGESVDTHADESE